jgi:diacylglycerol kinase
MHIQEFIRKRYRSFGHAFAGVSQLFRTETHFVLHLAALLLAVIAGFLLKLNNSEWIAVVLVSALVITTEAMNTAVERLTNLVSPNYNEQAKKIKDISAAAVLLSAIAAIAVGLIIFLPRLISLIRKY